jgi:hypothetical protein
MLTYANVCWRQADELQSLKFATPQERIDVLAQLGGKGIALHSAHVAADAALLSIRQAQIEP